jgi:hypothetical protein
VSQGVFDNAQLSAMRQAIDQIMEGDGVALKRYQVAHAVFAIARESGNFHTSELAKWLASDWRPGLRQR